MNAYTFSWEHISPLLGTRLASRSIFDLFERNQAKVPDLLQPVPIGVGTSKASTLIDTEEIDLHEDCGVKLRFKAANLLVGLETLYEDMVFSGITYYSAGEDRANHFIGNLPNGLSFLETQNTASQKLAAFPLDETGTNADRTYSFSRWRCKSYLLHLIFQAQSTQLRRVVCYLPLKRKQTR